MKKLFLVLTILTCLLISCPDGSSPNNKPVVPVKPTPKTLVVFDNTYGVCTAVVYDDYRRRDEDKIAEVPAGSLSNEIELPPSISEPFYFAYLLNLNGVSGFSMNYVPRNGKDQKAVRIDENTKTTVIIPKLDETFYSADQLLSPRSSLLLQNASPYSFELHRGRSSVPPDGKSASPVVNSREKAFYTINTSDTFDPGAGAVANYRLLVGADYKEFPTSPDRFEPGHFYSYTFNGDISLDSQIPINLDNVIVKSYTVTFNANGATGTTPVARTVKAGSVIKLPDGNGLSKTGFTFGGWNLAASGAEINYSSNADYLATGDLTLYAKWHPLGTVTYTVTFDSNGGSVVASQYTASGLAAFRPVNPIKNEYAFINWYGDSGLNTVYNFSTPVTGNITLYAKWDVTRECTVTFNANGATGTVPAAQTVNSGSGITLPNGSGLSKAGYTFGGWSTDYSGVEEGYSAGANYTVTGDITLFAKWNDNTPVTPGRVTSGADSGPGTLRYAIENAADGSTIVIDGSVGTIKLINRLNISKSITIEGNGVTITQDSTWTTTNDNIHALMYLYYSEMTNISRIHFKGGRAPINGAAILNHGGNLTLECCIFSENQDDGSQGSIILTSYIGNTSVKGCTFYDNRGTLISSYTWGHERRCTFILEGNLFYKNTASSSSYPIIVHIGGSNEATVTSHSYNVIDVPYGTGIGQCGWYAVIGDKPPINNLPISTTTFRLLPGSGAANVITTLPAGYPTVDFYGNPITNGAAAGAVQSTVSGTGFNLELSANDTTRGSVSASPTPNADGLVSGTVTLTANAKAGYEFSYWLVDGNQSSNANPLTLTINSHTKVQAVFGRVLLVTNFTDDMYSMTTPGTLRRALADAQDFDIIRFNEVIAGQTTIKLNDRLEISNYVNITIEGNGIIITRDSTWTTVDGYSQLMYIEYASVTIRRVHFKDGVTTYNGAAIYHDKHESNLTLESCIFSGNKATGTYSSGGAVYSVRLVLKGCTFYENSAIDSGAVDSSNGLLTFGGNLFYKNTSTYRFPVAYGQYPECVTSLGYNVVDVPLGTGGNQSGWDPATTDKTITELPFSTSDFKPLPDGGAVNVITTLPDGYPTTDFYGKPITNGAAAGAVQP